MRMLKNLHHGGIYCNNIDETILWYENLGFELLFKTQAMEGDKPLYMAWIKAGDNIILELLEQEDKETLKGAASTQNHISFRVDSMEAFEQKLNELSIPIEAGPFATSIEFDRQLDDSTIFSAYGDKGLNLIIMFFRGINGERFEVVQDNIGAL